MTQVLRLGMASTILLAATRRHLQSWGRTRHQSELAHISLHLVFGMENMHPDCSGAAESWLAQERSRQYGRRW